MPSTLDGIGGWMFRRFRVRGPVAAFLLLAAAGAAPPAARADDNPVFLQWFETRWNTIEYRLPDFFMAGYDSTWLPPPFKAADPTSAGFDCFDRFDLGRPGAETAYGTQEAMRAMIEEFHQASSLVYVDLVMNHNSGRNGSDDFHNAGGYPGFTMRIGADFWGDFNDGSAQSFDPGASNYNLFNGDLVGLIDIAHQKSYSYVRQPVSGTPGAGQVNIPPGTVRNRPDPRNRQFYPDVDNLAGRRQFVNPATGQTVTIFNIDPTDALQTDPLQMKGDPVMENANDYLLRSTQWLLDVINIDGFRLDAAKHIPQWFWNDLWDNAVFNRRRTFAGGFVTPFSFGEIVDSNSFTLSYTRKDGFGNRDALDLNGAGQLRDILNAGGFGTWQNVLNAHLDTADDGFQNGSRGVNHVFSHDNGSTGNGGSAPPLPGPERAALPQHCYLLFRPGPVIIYHNSREFIDRYQFRGFWPREGNPTALGATDQYLTRLIQAANGYARGEYVQRNSIINDAFVFERRRNNGPGLFESNVIVGVNDSFLNGSVSFNVYTSFPAGTRLHELTGTATDPTVDPNNQVADIIVTQAFNAQNPAISGAQSWMTITIPYNRNINGVAHHRGYVAYGPAAPSGTLAITQVGGAAFATQLPADPPSTPTYRRRLTPITIVTTPQFEIRLTTSKTDPLDNNWDDFAAFRIDGGFPSAGSSSDFNGSGGLDFSDSDPYIPRFESFLTQSSPLASTPGATNGVYRQVINTSSLSEGYHYIDVVAFRRRPGNTDPIFTRFRQVIYVDRSGPSVSLVDAALPITSPIYTARVSASDRTTNSVHILLNPPTGVDPLTLVSESNRANQFDRFEWRRTFSGLRFGSNTFVVVAFEPSGRSSVQTFTQNVTVGSGDINRDNVVDLNDLYELNRLLSLVPQPPPYDAAADLDANGTVQINDLRILEASLRPAELQNMSIPQR